MKKILTMLLLAVSLAGFSAQAYTASDLVGKQYCLIASTTEAYQPGLTFGKWCGEVSQGASSDKIVLKNMFGQFDCAVTVSGNKITIPDTNFGSWRLYKRKFKTAGFAERAKNNYAEVFSLVQGEIVSSALEADPNVLNSIYCGFSNDQNTGYGENEGFDLVYNYTNLANGNHNQMGVLQLWFYDTPDQAVQYNADGSTSDYPVSVLIDGNQIRINNLYGKGLAYNSEYDLGDGWGSTEGTDLIGTISGNTVKFPDYCMYGGKRGSSQSYLYSTQSQTLYNNSGTSFRTTGPLYDIASWNPWAFNVSYFTQNGYSDGGVTGTVESSDLRHEGHNGTNYWVHSVSGGQLKTYPSSQVITLNNPKVYDEGTDSFTENVSKIVITTGAAGHVTHDADLTINKFYYESGTGWCTVDFDITNRVNNEHVEGYDIMLAPGRHTGLGSFSPCPVNGHPDAIRLVTTSVPAARSVNNDKISEEHSFKLTTPGSATAATLEKLLDGQNTFFIRTRYTGESGLEPTFHALTTAMVQTGIDEFEVADADAPAEYYNMQGVRVSEPLPGNTYIRCQGNKAEKIRF